MNMIVLAVVLQTAPAQGVDVLLGGFRTVGLSDDETDKYGDQLETELRNLGVRMKELDEELDPACYDDLECLQANASKHKGLIDVELVRVGPFMQVKFRYWDARGELALDEDGMEDAETFGSEGKIVPAQFGEKVGASGQPLPEEEPAATTEPEPTQVTEELAAPAPAEPDDPAAQPILGYAGIGVAGVGGLLLVGGAVVAFLEAGTLEDRSSPGTDKERARVLGPVGLAAAGIGALAIGGGGALATMGFAGE